MQHHITPLHNTTPNITTQHQTSQHNTKHHIITPNNTTQHQTSLHTTTPNITPQHQTSQHNTTSHQTSCNNTTRHDTTRNKTKQVKIPIQTIRYQRCYTDTDEKDAVTVTHTDRYLLVQPDFECDLILSLY